MNVNFNKIYLIAKIIFLYSSYLKFSIFKKWDWIIILDSMNELVSTRVFFFFAMTMLTKEQVASQNTQLGYGMDKSMCQISSF